MKLSGAAAARFVARPDPRCPALLIYGEDAMRVALKRQDVVTALTGENADAEMRISRIAAGDARRDPALIDDAVRARGFFPGQRAVVIEDAGDGLTEALAAAIASWAEGDAMIVATAGILPKSSSLRKLFEGHPSAATLAIYSDAPDRAEVEAVLSAAGVRPLDREALQDFLGLAAALDPGDLRQTATKLALYTLDGDGPVTSTDVAAIAPAFVESNVQALIDAVATGREADVSAVIRRLGGKTTDLGRALTEANRHFRVLQSVKADPAGIDAAVSRIRPPLFGERRDRLVRQARSASAPALAAATAILTETELSLRSSSPVPEAALVERALIRIARRLRDDGPRGATRH